MQRKQGIMIAKKYLEKTKIFNHGIKGYQQGLSNSQSKLTVTKGELVSIYRKILAV
ncbi:hypothetical protein [Sulfurisphaera ohwakuensis]|uniref:Uncharacterized protein n=2 Tax=Sulfurisphaera ohwakuensis TaxID=69656 RepID=A0A7J9RXG1_SULOH|nr:hypothetical protein [Sulfurisphaera ohwakuensis]MBB5255166.1 hypothetical protein [Sulfurisphaera ohwakuensis]